VGHEKNFYVAVCGSCGLAHILPRPTDPEGFQSEDTGSYDSSVRHLHQGFSYHHRILLKKLGRYLPPPGRLLEIGCSSGSFLKAAKKEGYQVFGVESALLDPVLKSEMGECVINERIERANLSPNSFDVAVAIQVIEHMHDPLILLKKIAESLRPGGYVYIETPNYGSLARRCRSSRFMDLNVAPGHWHLFDSFSLKGIFRQAGVEPLTSWTFFKALSSYGKGPIRPLLVRALNCLFGPLGLANTLALIGRKMTPR